MATAPIPIPGAQSLQDLITELRARTSAHNPDAQTGFLSAKAALLAKANNGTLRESDRAQIKSLLDNSI